MKEAITAALLTDLSCELSNEELGAAIRIISRVSEGGKPLSRRTIHIVAGVDQNRWKEMETAVLEFFMVDEQQVSFVNFADIQQGAVLASSLPPRSRQGELAIVSPKIRRPEVPQYAIDEQPEKISIRKVIYDQAVKLFMNAGQSEKTARAILSGMLKNYPEGDVATAVADAVKKDCLAEPHTWILGRLKAENRKRNATSSQAPPPSRNKIVTPELGGISNSRADKIRQKNAKLKQPIVQSS